MSIVSACSQQLASTALGLQSNTIASCPGVRALANGTLQSRLVATKDCTDPACAPLFLALESLSRASSLNCSVWDEDTSQWWSLHHVNQSICPTTKASVQSTYSSVIGAAKSFPVGVIVVIVIILIVAALIYMYKKSSTTSQESQPAPAPHTQNAHAPVYCDPPPQYYYAPPPQEPPAEAPNGLFGLSQEQIDQFQDVATGIYHAYTADNGEFFGDVQVDGGGFYETDGGGFV
ncbi:Aste57867_3198 [Aphanomyces stellatus]|uniref:Aste57867_3198 protein n=1 Tax=Aphanomyces stellatus TaxID=120398 RepID=A0A485KD07_9STRA|nr:hypothetical protein As57867_003188 [Aphanomyces stellatus]VFT80372.1 Aste57867_3198 [Aphanomyces stellatus]